MPLCDTHQITCRPPQTPDDFRSIAAMAKALAAHHGEDHAPDPLKLQTDRTEWYDTAMACMNDKIAGYIAWCRAYESHTSERRFEVHNLFVLPEYRQQHVAQRLIGHLAKAAITHDVTNILITYRKDNPQACAFYPRLSGTIIDRHDTWRCRLERDAIQRLAADSG